MSLEHETSAVLLTLIQQGDRSAEQELFLRHGKALLYVLRQRAGNPHEAEDVSQETWRVLLEKFRQYGQSALDDPEKLPAYIRHTAVNIYLAQARKQVRRKTDVDSEALDAALAEDEGVLDELARKRLQQCVRGCIAELRNDRDRKLLYYYYIEERSKEAVCAELELDARHFDRVAHRARERFRKVAEDNAFAFNSEEGPGKRKGELFQYASEAANSRESQ